MQYLRTDPPTEIIMNDKGRSLLKGENYVVCMRNGSQEIVVQSDRDADRAQHSVDILNEHEENNARQPVFYWRPRTSRDQPQ
jgi:ABC-type uncharacterized transport system ATPase subunit